MKAEQISFAAGEISPVLHARTDLTRYMIGLAELVNMIVLPQGGVTRRAGIERLNANIAESAVKLIPFEYSTTDSAMLVFGGERMHVVRRTETGNYVMLAVNIATPYTASEVKDLRYVQSGNVMFLTHKNHKPMMLRRNSLRSWTLEELPFRGGPWINGEEWASGVKLRFSTMAASKTINSIGGNVFSSNVKGSLLKVEYAVKAKTQEMTSTQSPGYTQSEPFVVKGTMNVTTAGEWRGLIRIDRSADGGNTWVTIRQYRRTDTETQGQWDFTISETEENILYRVRAEHGELRTAEEKEPVFNAAIENDYRRKRTSQLPVSVGLDVNVSGVGNSSSEYEGTQYDQTGNKFTVAAYFKDSTDPEYDYEYEEGDIGTILTKYKFSSAAKEDTPATVNISVSGYLKSEVYKIGSILSDSSAIVELQNDTRYTLPETEPDGYISLWSIGAWGVSQGYPRACAMYQDRLVLAGSNLQPQTIWMSRTGDYADFSTSDPLRDDDAVNITLAGSRADGIHSLTASSDLLVFTHGGEWKIKGAGDAGAITPTALAAHQQTSIGTKDIQPVIAGGNVILVQAQGRKVYALGYDLNTDGYAGSEISIMSSHMFEGKKIVDMAYQQEPDSLLWFVLDDGTCAVCTYNPEHEVIGWSRQIFGKKIAGTAAMTSEVKTEIFCWSSDYALLYMKDRTAEAGYTDYDGNYESRIRTLRLAGNGEDGSAYTSEKLIARLIVSVLRSSGAWAAPGDYSDDGRNWERRRRIEMDYTEYVKDEEIQLDNGFSIDACIQIRSMDDKPLTIAGITPVITTGG